MTLPGAFVGVLIGSRNPVQAGAAQLLVLIGLLAAESVPVVIVLELVARGWIRRPATAQTSALTGTGPRRRRAGAAPRIRAVTGRRHRES